VKFKFLLEMISNKKKKFTFINELVAEKIINLMYHEVHVFLEKNIDERYNLIIKSTIDPNIKGYVEYQTEEDALLAFDHLDDGYGYVVDYLFRNCKDHGTAMNWSKIVVDEIKANYDGFNKNEISINVTPIGVIDNMNNVNSNGA